MLFVLELSHHFSRYVLIKNVPYATLLQSSGVRTPSLQRYGRELPSLLSTGLFRNQEQLLLLVAGMVTVVQSFGEP